MYNSVNVSKHKNSEWIKWSIFKYIFHVAINVIKQFYKFTQRMFFWFTRNPPLFRSLSINELICVLWFRDDCVERRNRGSIQFGLSGVLRNLAVILLSLFLRWIPRQIGYTWSFVQTRWIVQMQCVDSAFNDFKDVSLKYVCKKMKSSLNDRNTVPIQISEKISKCSSFIELNNAKPIFL